ncbi:tRNA (adenosine(37)-N6)-threonylcarbamoyltransferase complex transferase subunit TsaD [uncultured Brachyspira sp.]|uniref:tRNA (adenosine(37)-N6)-threonylcarbamoyltransferase complex transferase subunit TsaD n=1 Tax=uncultured Brachyspira sp. TaxID=221953 RepID=UPI0025D42CF3|nr:tRNA (adenosine(37)-N6)-threonylcarbamoyltransferase complex transferase subunit TsaD [uncultured Brachyspira sp.]
MKILGIDTSCDDTSAAVVENGNNVLSSVLSSSIDAHKDFQGVVPEIAARKHLEAMLYVIDKALKDAELSLNDIDLFAVTNRPGLLGSLLVGVSSAKALAFSLDKPLLALDHIAAHIYSPHLTNNIEFPYIALVVSGGHTIITEVCSYGEYKVIGTTLDDAVGEAYDKVAKFLNLGYPGGPIIDKMAKEGNKDAIKYPIVLLSGKDEFNFSYSGLKTACVYSTKKYLKEGYEATNENIAAAFQISAIEPLYIKTLKYIEKSGIKRVTLSGGVACNSYLRERFGNSKDFECFLPDIKYTTDNAAMTAGLAYYMKDKQEYADYSLDCFSRILNKKYNKNKSIKR